MMLSKNKFLSESKMCDLILRDRTHILIGLYLDNPKPEDRAEYIRNLKKLLHWKDKKVS